MLSTICMTYISCKLLDWYKNRPNIENPASARASDSFWSKVLLQKGRGLLILPKKCWEPLYTVCEVLLILIRKIAFKKCVPCLYIVKVYKNINETKISSQHFFKSAGYKLSISIISPWTKECMSLRFWVLCGISSS